MVGKLIRAAGFRTQNPQKSITGAVLDRSATGLSGIGKHHIRGAERRHVVKIKNRHQKIDTVFGAGIPELLQKLILGIGNEGSFIFLLAQIIVFGKSQKHPGYQRLAEALPYRDLTL